MKRKEPKTNISKSFQLFRRIKMEINKKNISELRNEIDSLKIQIHKVSVQIDDTIRENATLKRMCENREN